MRRGTLVAFRSSLYLCCCWAPAAVAWVHVFRATRRINATVANAANGRRLIHTFAANG